MQKGRIVEQGTHEQLLAHNGTYKKLVTMQSLES
jgi:subfamily B ATP-binding cassette protein MsbA